MKTTVSGVQLIHLDAAREGEGQHPLVTITTSALPQTVVPESPRKEDIGIAYVIDTPELSQYRYSGIIQAP